MKVRQYSLGTRGIRVAVLADLHNKPWDRILAQTGSLKPDIIAVPGDVTLGFTGFDRVEDFLNACGQIAPTFLSVGNHDDKERLRLLNCKVTFLDNAYADITVKGVSLRLGGLSSPHFRRGRSQGLYPDTAWLAEFCRTTDFKLLLCHQPEYYPAYLAELAIDCVLSGHAHGGQWRIPFTKQGIYAPGQGLLPKHTGGVEDGRLVISRGVSNSSWIPRLFNPREIVLVNI